MIGIPACKNNQIIRKLSANHYLNKGQANGERKAQGRSKEIEIKKRSKTFHFQYLFLHLLFIPIDIGTFQLRQKESNQRREQKKKCQTVFNSEHMSITTEK